MFNPFNPLDRAMRKEGLTHHDYYIDEASAQKAADMFERAGYRVVITYHQERAFNSEYGYKPYRLCYSRRTHAGQ